MRDVGVSTTAQNVDAPTIEQIDFLGRSSPQMKSKFLVSRETDFIRT